MTLTSHDIIISVDDLTAIRDLIAETAGLYFEKNKYYYLEKRVARRVKITNSETSKDYYRLLKLGHYPTEMRELISALTINETYFYRNMPQLESFSQEALKLVIDTKRKAGDYTLNIWSAACSSGEEPYTLSILLRQSIPDYSQWTVNILATDIDYQILEKAKSGIYSARSVKDVPPDILEKYFSQKDGQFVVDEKVKDNVEIKNLNLMNRQMMRVQPRMDFVFCRNVLIYFNGPARIQVINSIYDNLKPGGFIFLGHSESVGRISAAFKLVKLEKTLAYRK